MKLIILINQFMFKFIIIYLIINIGIPSWKQPFSNTIGYSIANIIINSNSIFKDSLIRPGNMPLISDNPKENPKSGIQQYMTNCLLYTSPSPRDQRGSRMPASG
mgnify:CR=1 FL=1